MRFGRHERLIRRILIVEDEPLVAFDEEHMLQDAGYEVVATVSNVADARRVIDQEALDLVLTDVRLSGAGDGTTVARAARARGVPVLFVTAFPSVDTEGLGLGRLEKPYTGKVLRRAIDALDRQLQGGKPGRVPPQLTLFAPAAAGSG